MTLLASIPSPSSGDVEIGPFALHAYGVMLLLGIAAATWLTGVRWTRAGGDWDLVYRVAMWGVLGGVIGARLYHVLTSWSTVDGDWWEPFAIWRGGLGVWGGILGGVLAGSWVVRRSGESVYRFLDAAAPGILLAQAVGRWGNYFNQELFGKPTGLPWGLEIDPVNRPEGFVQSDTFHPIFLYESLWNLLGVALLLVIGSRLSIKPPGLFALYVAWYTFGRTFEELLRVDPSHEFLGQRLNFWVSAVIFVLAVLAFVWSQRRTERPERPRGARRREPPAPAKKMTIPKGRVRHGR